jgi:hypothetical protein
MRKFLEITIALLLSGCVSNQEYPEGWKPVEKVNNQLCPALDGAYSNIGESNSDRYIPTLAEILMPKYGGSTDNIEITNFESSFLLSAIQNGESKAKFELPKNGDDIYCKNGALIIEKGKVVNREGAVGKEWDSFVIQKNEQGLVINRHHGAVGMLFFVPIAGKESLWFLYKKT